jgi:hypothetical protein
VLRSLQDFFHTVSVAYPTLAAVGIRQLMQMEVTVRHDAGGSVAVIESILRFVVNVFVFSPAGVHTRIMCVD